MTRAAVHISPLLPPQNSGVGDYAMAVGQRIETTHSIQCAFIAAGHTLLDTPTDGPRVWNICGVCDAKSLWQAVQELMALAAPSSQPSKIGCGELTATDKPNVAIILNYSGYGYDRNGCPNWLVEALRERPRWVEQITTYFHELYAKGRPWQRAFWYSSRQRRIAVEVARLSDAVLTNCTQYARWLEKQTGRSPGSICSLPVPSNVGEPEFVGNIDS